MRLQITKSKNSESFYIAKSFRDKRGKCTSKIIEKLGTREELQAKLGRGVDIVEWGRKRAFLLTEQEKLSEHKVMVAYSPAHTIEAGKRRSFGGGYLFLQSLYHDLRIDDMCKSIASRHDFKFDLDEILSRLIYGRILSPSSKRATCEFSNTLIEQPKFACHHIYRALEVLAQESDFIQAALYENSKQVIGRKTKVLYYDCTNYFFEIEQGDDFRRYGHSKQHQPAPLVEMGLFMDAEGIPLAFCMHPGSKNEQTTMIPLEEQIKRDFNLSEFVCITDGGLSSLSNRKFNTQGKRQFITTQSVKKLKAHLKTWALDTSGWHLSGSDVTFDLERVGALLESEEADQKTKDAFYNRTFYKYRRVKEKDKTDDTFFEQNLIVTFSFKYRTYQQRIRQGHIDRAVSAIESNSTKLDRKNQNDYRRFVATTCVTPDGEIAGAKIHSLNTKVIEKEAAYDGFYALATSLDTDDVDTILKVSSRRWEIEECFRIMKTEFKARPVYLSREDRIRAHFLTCFISLLVYRILEKKLHDKFTCAHIISTLKDMDFMEVRGEGYVPLYTRTEVTDALHETFGFRTDFEIVTDKEMKRIIKMTKTC